MWCIEETVGGDGSLMECSSVLKCRLHIKGSESKVRTTLMIGVHTRVTHCMEGEQVVEGYAAILVHYDHQPDSKTTPRPDSIASPRNPAPSVSCHSLAPQCMLLHVLEWTIRPDGIMLRRDCLLARRTLFLTQVLSYLGSCQPAKGHGPQARRGWRIFVVEQA